MRTLTSLHSKGRFLLTGTPVENSLDDLLSLFSFLMPGYLQKACSSSRRRIGSGTVAPNGACCCLYFAPHQERGGA